MAKLSAKDFHDPLLKVLATLSDGKAGTVVRFKDTYRPVMDAMGIADVMDHGLNEASGSPIVEKWIQWAFSSARKAGLGETKGRGKWALTDAGLAHVSKLTGGTATPQTASATVAPTTSTTKGISIVMSNRNDESAYHEDAYIRALAIGRTSCFEAYSDHASAVCVDCPLSGACQNAYMGALSKLALVFAAEDTAAAAPKAPKVPKKTSAKVPTSDTPPPVDIAGIDFSNADEILSRIEAACAACGGVIKEKEKCLWVESVGDDDIDDEGALFHLHCGGK